MRQSCLEPRPHRSKHTQTCLPGAKYGRVAPGVAQPLVLLVRWVVLLVDDDKPELRHWRQYSQPCAEDNSRFAARGSQPPRSTRRGFEPAVQNADGGIGKRRAESRFELRGQADFRYQDQRLPSLRERFGDQVQVDFSLAASGHAVQQEWRETAQSDCDRFQHGLLRTSERMSGDELHAGNWRGRLDPARLHQRAERNSLDSTGPRVGVQQRLFLHAAEHSHLRKQLGFPALERLRSGNAAARTPEPAILARQRL